LTKLNSSAQNGPNYYWNEGKEIIGGLRKMCKKLRNSSPNIIRLNKSARMTSEGYERRKCPKFLWGNLKEKYCVENLGTGGDSMKLKVLVLREAIPLCIIKSV